MDFALEWEVDALQSATGKKYQVHLTLERNEPDPFAPPLPRWVLGRSQR
jgi:hypothetical protein